MLHCRARTRDATPMSKSAAHRSRRCRAPLAHRSHVARSNDEEDRQQLEAADRQNPRCAIKNADRADSARAT
jgi:hypothetical protein